MYAEERQAVIAQKASEHGRVEVARLAAELQVTPETVRRDLSRLERRGVLRRVHGGAITLERDVAEPAVTEREDHMSAEKESIGKRAAAELPASGSVLLDAGTTTSRLVDAFPRGRELTVVTNALDALPTLASMELVTTYVLGGRVRGRTMAAVDHWAADVLADLYVDVAFIATNGVSAARGLTTPDPAEARTKQAMVKAARRVVLLADHTKVGNDHLVRFADITEIDTLITDPGIDDELAEEIAAAGVEVIRA